MSIRKTVRALPLGFYLIFLSTSILAEAYEELPALDPGPLVESIEVSSPARLNDLSQHYELDLSFIVSGACADVVVNPYPPNDTGEYYVAYHFDNYGLSNNCGIRQQTIRITFSNLDFDKDMLIIVGPDGLEWRMRFRFNNSLQSQELKYGFAGRN